MRKNTPANANDVVDRLPSSADTTSEVESCCAVSVFREWREHSQHVRIMHGSTDRAPWVTAHNSDLRLGLSDLRANSGPATNRNLYELLWHSWLCHGGTQKKKKVPWPLSGPWPWPLPLLLLRA